MKTRRLGLGLLEVSVAIALLGALVTVVMQALDWTMTERREAARREIALVEAANVIERLSAADGKTLEAKASSEEPLSAVAKEVLPGGRLTTEIQPARDDPAAMRIVVEVQWLNRAGEQDAPVRLTTWVWRNKGSGLGIRDSTKQQRLAATR